MKTKLLLLFFLFGMNLLVSAQDEEEEEDDTTTTEEVSKEDACKVGCENGWCWGNDPKTAKEKNVIYTDALAMKDYATAQPALEWLLTNTPCLNKSIYINAETLYKALLKKAKTDEDKEKYQDKVFEIYENRIKYFGQEKFVKRKLGAVAFAYLVNRGDNTLEGKTPHWTRMYNIYDDIVKLQGEDVTYYNLRYYFLSVGRMHKIKKLTDDQLLDLYDMAKPLAEKKVKAGNQKEKWEKTDNAIEATLHGEVDIDCNFVREKWGEEIKTNPKNIKVAKKAIRFMIMDTCTTDPLFIVAVENVYHDEKSPAMAKLIAQWASRNDDEAKAEKFYKEMIILAGGEIDGKGAEDGGFEGVDIEEDLALQAEGYSSLAKMLDKSGKFGKAREYYLKAASKDPESAKEAYSRIGNMYMRSWKMCLKQTGGNPIQDRAPYLAAYDMFVKAGDGSGQARAKAQFPTKEDIFTWGPKVGLSEGSSISVGCWIGGSTTVRSR